MSADPTLAHFREMAYIPWNHLFAVVGQAASYSQPDLEAAADEITRDASQRVDEMTPTQRVVFEWMCASLRELVLQFGAGVGTSDPPPAFGTDRDSLEAVGRYLCKLKGKPFMGIEPPQPVVRYSRGPGTSAVVDIVPSDPRWGWDDIPDWHEPL